MLASSVHKQELTVDGDRIETSRVNLDNISQVDGVVIDQTTEVVLAFSQLDPSSTTKEEIYLNILVLILLRVDGQIDLLLEDIYTIDILRATILDGILSLQHIYSNEYRREHIH